MPRLKSSRSSVNLAMQTQKRMGMPHAGVRDAPHRANLRQPRPSAWGCDTRMTRKPQWGAPVLQSNGVGKCGAKRCRFAASKRRSRPSRVIQCLVGKPASHFLCTWRFDMEHDYKCPGCGASMEKGFLNAPFLGIAWFTNPRRLWLIGKGIELLQRDWLGLWPFRPTKASLPA